MSIDEFKGACEVVVFSRGDIAEYEVLENGLNRDVIARGSSCCEFHGPIAIDDGITHNQVLLDCFYHPEKPLHHMASGHRLVDGIRVTQVIVSSICHHAALLKDQNAVRNGDGTKAMGDNKGSATLNQIS